MQIAIHVYLLEDSLGLLSFHGITQLCPLKHGSINDFKFV